MPNSQETPTNPQADPPGAGGGRGEGRPRKAQERGRLGTGLPLGPAAHAVRSEASTPRPLCSGRLNGEASPWPRDLEPRGVQAAILIGGWIRVRCGVITLPRLSRDEQTRE